MLETFTNGEIFSLQVDKKDEKGNILSPSPLRELSKLDVPAKVGIRIARLIRKLSQEIEPINDVRNKLILKYGVKDEKGQTVINAAVPQFEAFSEEHNSLMKQTTKIEFEKVVLPDEVHVALDVLVALEPFLAVADIPGISTSSNGVAKEVPELVTK